LFPSETVVLSPVDRRALAAGLVESDPEGLFRPGSAAS
jgi:hypothetical protein